MRSKLEGILDKLEKICSPISIFLYGSRSRDNYLKVSDFEIGVLMDEKNYVSRTEIYKKIRLNNRVKVYPFKIQDLNNKTLNTPFHSKIFLRELSDSGKTMRGEEIIENIKSPKIEVIDLLEDINFCIGKAETSRISYENGDLKTSRPGFYKSCLYGTRDLEIVRFKVFPRGYGEIHELAKTLHLGNEEDYWYLIDKAINVREGKAKPAKDDFYKNISYLRTFVEREIKRYLETNGNVVLLK